MYLKRNKTPKSWPIERKGTKYVVSPTFGLKNNIPLLIVVRDILKLAKTRKEVVKLINMEKIKVNNKKVKDVKYPIKLLDILTLGDKNFKLTLKGKKFDVVEIKSKEAKEKIVKVIDKKILKGEKTQINLEGGGNYLFKKKVNVGDSVAIDLEKNKISEVLPLKNGAKILITGGKYFGEKGKIKEVKEGGKVLLKLDKEDISTNKENVMVIKW